MCNQVRAAVASLLSDVGRAPTASRAMACISLAIRRLQSRAASSPSRSLPECLRTAYLGCLGVRESDQRRHLLLRGGLQRLACTAHRCGLQLPDSKFRHDVKSKACRCCSYSGADIGPSPTIFCCVAASGASRARSNCRAPHSKDTQHETDVTPVRQAGRAFSGLRAPTATACCMPPAAL